MPSTSKYKQHELLLQIAKIIKQERAKLNISQEELAFLAGVHRTYIGMIENADQNVTIMTVKKLCDAMGISLSDFFRDFKDKKDSKVAELKDLQARIEKGK